MWTQVAEGPFGWSTHSVPGSTAGAWLTAHPPDEAQLAYSPSRASSALAAAAPACASAWA